MPRPKPHPLEPMVWRALAVNSGSLDATALAYFLASPYVYVRSGHQAYRTVARDVLGYMEKQGSSGAIAMVGGTRWYRHRQART